ncbi:hypothetical protein L3i22_081820 [Actinoplanes sp. L3-i22]|nr:hypothetical protein L3i22_081820 [Actinoplanes sp. L3-i22]
MLFAAFFTVFAGLGAIDPEHHLKHGDRPGSREGALFWTIVAGLALLALLTRAPKKLRKSGITVDATGVQGIPWDDLAGVGVGFQGPASSRSTGYVLELFPNPGVDLTDRLPGLTPADATVPRVGLPSARQRLAIPEDAIAQVEEAVRAYAPQSWIGIYPSRS